MKKYLSKKKILAFLAGLGAAVAFAVKLLNQVPEGVLPADEPVPVVAPAADAGAQ